MKIEVKSAGKKVVFQFSGVLDEHADFAALKSNPSENPVINCKEVERANSNGLKKWCTFFQELRDRNIVLTFVECSPAILEQANVLMGFIKSEEIHSVCAHYFCESCKHEELPVYTIESIRKLKFKMPNLVCPNCRGNMNFDEIPEQVFAIFME